MQPEQETKGLRERVENSTTDGDMNILRVKRADTLLLQPLLSTVSFLAILSSYL